jgi:hypothetical protein
MDWLTQPDQLVSLAGALMILGAYAAAQLGWLKTGDRPHSVLNTIGGLLVAVIAGKQQQPAVVLLEGTWALISALALVRALRRRPAEEIAP